MTTSTTDDRYRVMGILEPLSSGNSMQVIVHPGEPASKSRARIVKGHAYTPDKTRIAQEALAVRFLRCPTFQGNVAVVCMFYRGNRQRIDIDNLLKLVLDAATQGQMWLDDSQVTAVHAVLGCDPANPRTIVGFAEHESSMTRGPAHQKRCAKCQTPFNDYGNSKRQHCSRECRTFLADPILCTPCGKTFKRKGNYQKYCSNTCRATARAQETRAATLARTHCKRGHAMTADNTHTVVDGRRRCRRCQAENAQRYRAAAAS